jgi:hypothetical protein
MTEEVMRRLVRECLDLDQVDDHLKLIIRQELDYPAIAREIWETWQDEIHEAAAKMAAEELLPF